MDHGSSGATALLGMDGFVVLASIEEAGELFISVETTADVVGCADCGVRAIGHGRSALLNCVRPSRAAVGFAC